MNAALKTLLPALALTLAAAGAHADEGQVQLLVGRIGRAGGAPRRDPKAGSHGGGGLQHLTPMHVLGHR